MKRMRTGVACAAIALAAFASAVQAEAAMAVRMVLTPAAPVVGQDARLSVQTLAPFTQKCVGEPDADYRPWSDWSTSDGGPLRLVAQATREGSAPIDVPLARRESDETWWDGTIAFPVAGTWILRMAYPTWGQGRAEAEACAGARVTVTVVDRLPATSTSAELSAVGFDAFAAAVAALVLLARWRAAQQRA